MSTRLGYFLIADITGYTQYLGASELEHAQQTLTALLNLLIHDTRPPLVISRLAGDAVISYGLSDNFLTGQTFAETIEDTYVDFRRAIERMVHNTTCPCNACRNIGTLDLKFFVHHGEFAVQKLDAHDELVGSEVILIHRLLKNHVTEATGFRAYTLFTDAALTRLGLGTEGLVAHQESYENFGPVAVWIEDMHPVWEAKRQLTRVSIPGDSELMRVSAEIALPRERVWDYVVQPEHYRVLLAATHLDINGKSAGRVAVGSVFQCYHGDAIIPLTVLEWQPFEQMLVEYVSPVPIRGVSGLTELRLEDSGTGTRLTQIFSKSSGPLLGRMMSDAGLKSSAKQFQHDIEQFARHIEADHAQHPPEDAMPTIAAAEIGAAARQSLGEIGA
ncbi:hypothetical protein ASC89_19270 [Devosia sp. Root413D1]|uniref:DUF2652 domain-containing protein n=1 Tax=unclassified Devosia TaxID=196773 RepID=UPI0006F3F08B|nr:DUF2652 domain-containing protein [Devosia sp. Root413D1]KQW77331.1 hypothetical protein ASC89_19270 [Devosia sp. Root413D1]